MVERFLLYPTDYSRLISIRKNIYEIVGTLNAEALPSKEPIPFAELKNHTFQKVEEGYGWGGLFDCCWFSFKGHVPASAKGKVVSLLIDVNGEGAIYDMKRGGEVIQGITHVLSGVDAVQSLKGKQVVDMLDCAEGGEEIDILADCGNNGFNGNGNYTAKLNRKDIAVKNLDVFGYYYDYLTLFALILTRPDNDNLFADRVKEIRRAIEASYKLYKKGDVKAARFLLIAEINRPNEGKINRYTAVGHAHLDLGWLWPIRETKRKALRTFTTALCYIDKYPEYVFGASQAQQFEWVKDEQPQTFDKLKKAVADGRIELQGGMWTENDSNVPCGESLIRQFVYGDKFFYDEFKKRSNIVWLPDAFGFPACLPAIYKGCERDYFMTIKLTWNEHNKFPYKTFVWQGIDGSKVLSHMAPLGNYNAGASPLSVIGSEKKNQQSKDIDKALMVYGVGDGGGGPGEGHLEFVTREKNIKGLNPVECAPAESFFDALKDDIDKIPVYEGELYLEKHQGTYTSQGRNKQFNYLLERELHNVEWLGAAALTKGIKYPKERVDKIWKEVLLYQFHDILPGSSIERIYDESRARYAVLLEEAVDIRNELIDAIKISGEKCLLNPTSFERKGYIKAFEKWYSAVAMPYSAAKLTKAAVKEAVLTAEENLLENDLIRVEFGRGGDIVSLTDKATGKQYAKNGLNSLVLHTDPKRHYNAWDIDIKYPKKKTVRLKPAATKSFIDGKQAVMELVYVTKKSKIVQKVILTEGERMIQVDNSIDWHEKHKMLRAEFYPAVYTDKVNCDIQFGSIDRSTLNKTSIEKAQYEICAHKFVNFNDGEYGFAVINNCKFGHRAKEGLLSVNLLRSPKYPDKNCDMGEHNFSYGIYVYSGSAEESGLVKEAYSFAYPFIQSDCTPDVGRLLAVDHAGIVVETVKPSENGKGIIARLYERYGVETDCRLITGFKFSGMFTTNMLERKGQKAGKELNFRPFEIKTVYFEL